MSRTPYGSIDHDAVLSLWALGATDHDISLHLGLPGKATARKIVLRARKRGDIRAIAHPRGPRPSCGVRAILDRIEARAERTGKAPAAVLSRALEIVFLEIEDAVFDDEGES